jgi:hypothetical protein
MAQSRRGDPRSGDGGDTGGASSPRPRRRSTAQPAPAPAAQTRPIQARLAQTQPTQTQPTQARPTQARPPRTGRAAFRRSSRPGPQGEDRPQSLWGTRPGKAGVYTVVAGTVLGALITLVSGSEPGWVLGLLLVISTTIGGLLVTRCTTYLLIPVPAVAYTVAAFVTGYIHDRPIDTTRAELAASAVQWIAGGFFAMTAATLLAIAIVVGRWLFAGPGGRRAYGDLSGSRPFRAMRYSRPARAVDAASGRERADDPAPPSLPAGPRHSA